MGCDIHCYIEYKSAGRDNWHDFGGQINPGRNYWMFGFMAGVRCDELPHIEPRGLLPDMAYAARNDASIYVDDSLTVPFEHVDGGTHYSRARAEEYVSKGYASYTDERKNFVTNCDWHSHSWLTAAEFEKCLADYLAKCGFQINTPKLEAPKIEATVGELSQEDRLKAENIGALTEYWAILAVLRCFEAQGKQARLVFWFDN